MVYDLLFNFSLLPKAPEAPILFLGIKKAPNHWSYLTKTVDMEEVSNDGLFLITDGFYTHFVCIYLCNSFHFSIGSRVISDQNTNFVKWYLFNINEYLQLSTFR